MNTSRANTPFPNVLAFFAAAVGLVTVVFVGYSVVRSSAAQHWPTTVGTVFESRVLPVDYSNGPGSRLVQRAEVRYRYEVNDKSFESENLNFKISQIGGARRYYPPEAAAQYPVGVSIRVSYDPADPVNAVSDPSPIGNGYLKLIGGVLLLLGGAFYLATHRSDTDPGKTRSNPRPFVIG